MQIKELQVNEQTVLKDSEGYIVNMDEWSEAFVTVQARNQKLVLTEEYWDVIMFLRAYYDEHGVQCEVRKMVKHFKEAWAAERGSSPYLHRIFPRGGPQKQGNRLAGLLRTKGEH